MLDLPAGAAAVRLQHGGDRHRATGLDDTAVGPHAVVPRAGALHLEAHFPSRRVTKFKMRRDYGGEGAFELEVRGWVED